MKHVEKIPPKLSKTMAKKAGMFLTWRFGASIFRDTLAWLVHSHRTGDFSWFQRLFSYHWRTKISPLITSQGHADSKKSSMPEELGWKHGSLRNGPSVIMQN